MRPNAPTRKPSNTRIKHNPSPSLALHMRHAQLCQEERAAGINSPRLLESLNRHFSDTLRSLNTARSTRIIKQNVYFTELARDVSVQLAHAVEVAEVRLEECDLGLRWGCIFDGGFELLPRLRPGGVVVQCEVPALPGEGYGCCFADATCGTGYKGELALGAVVEGRHCAVGR